MAFSLSLTTPPEPGRSIHYRRRYAYGLWVAMLFLSLGALALWEQPLSVAPASLQVQLQVLEAPKDTRVLAWAGPCGQWDGPGRFREAVIQVTLQPDGRASLPLFRLPIARRRWVKGYVPRSTWDLMMLKFTPPDGQPKYMALPLSQDIRMGFLKPRYRFFDTIRCHWRGLKDTAQAPDPMP